MAKRRKKSSAGKALSSLVKHAFIYLFKGVYLVFKYLFLGVWWVIKHIGIGIGQAFSWLTVRTSEKVEEYHKSATKKAEHRAAKKENPALANPATYQPLEVRTSVQGDVVNFENKLYKDSLIVAIAGKRGSGKSTLGFLIMENIHAKNSRPCYVIGVKQAVLPEWIHSIETIEQVNNGGVVLVDEGAISFSSRESMSKKNKELGKLMAIARHKDLTLILITQNTGMLDKNVLNLTDTIMLKQGSLLQSEMERPVMRKLYEKVDKQFDSLAPEERKGYTYVFDAEFEGLIQTPLPTFWSTKISKNQA